MTKDQRTILKPMEPYNHLTKFLLKVCSLYKNDWDDKLPTILWVYRKTYKRSTVQTPSKMVYNQEVVVPLYLKQEALEIAQVLKIDTTKAKEERLFQLQKLEEEKINSMHH